MGCIIEIIDNEKVKCWNCEEGNNIMFKSSI